MSEQYVLDVRWMVGMPELIVTVAGKSMVPPAVINLDTGTSATLRPARIEVGICGTVFDCQPAGANGYWGELAVDHGATEAHLALVIEGLMHRCTARRAPDPEPLPMPPPQSKRRGRRKTA